MKLNTLTLADCFDGLRDLPANSIHSVVTDPPYGLSNETRDYRRASPVAAQRAKAEATSGFMGCEWDADVPSADLWREVYRVLKPGGHILSFGSTRTYHRMVTAIEDAGFEVRDTICWHHAQGFPKSLNVSAAIDRAKGAQRKVVGRRTNGIASGTHEHAGSADAYGFNVAFDVTAPATQEAAQWNGWGTALKPATELIALARKPLAMATAADWHTAPARSTLMQAESG